VAAASFLVLALGTAIYELPALREGKAALAAVDEIGRTGRDSKRSGKARSNRTAGNCAA